MRAGSWAALAMAALLGSLVLVAWRQGQAFEAREALAEVRDTLALGRQQRQDLRGEIQFLSSRSRIQEEAADRFGLRSPVDQIVIRRLEAF